jgi:Uma2 family endonuclease
MLKLGHATIDDTVKPPIEWIDGRPVQKPWSTDVQAFLQAIFGRFLLVWAAETGRGRGRVGTEWRFQVPSNVYDTLSVVPDVAYLAGYFDLPRTERRYPSVPPDIAVEIRSPGDDEADIAKKRDFYLDWGVKLVINVDPERRTVETREQNSGVFFFDASAVLVSRAFPTLAIPLQAIFAVLDEPE